MTRRPRPLVEKVALVIWRRMAVAYAAGVLRKELPIPPDHSPGTLDAARRILRLVEREKEGRR